MLLNSTEQLLTTETLVSNNRNGNCHLLEIYMYINCYWRETLIMEQMSEGKTYKMYN